MSSASAFRDVSRIESLPGETLAEIFGHLVPSHLSDKDNTQESRRDLRSLSLVSKRLGGIATRILYEHIFVSSVKQLVLLNRTLGATPSLSSFIRKLAISVTIRFDTPRLPHDRPQHESREHENFRRTLIRILKLSSNVCELLFDIVPCHPYYKEWEEASEHIKDVPEENIPYSWYFIITDWKLAVPQQGFSPFNELVTPTVSSTGDTHYQFLPNLQDLYFYGSSELWDSCTYSPLFSIPSLRRIICLWDSEDWERANGRNSILPGGSYAHIEVLELHDSIITPRGISKICTIFPSLRVLKITNNTQRMDLPSLGPSDEDSSRKLADMKNLVELSLLYHNPSIPAFHNQPWGPEGGLTGLAGLERLTNLTIAMNVLMRYVDDQASNDWVIEPLGPEVLPSSLKQLRLYTCLYCWDGNLWWEPDRSSKIFVDSLAAQLDHFPHLERVSYSCGREWWIDDHFETRSSEQRRDAETGETWYAGCFVECADTFAARNVHFRPFHITSREFNCGVISDDDLSL